MEMIKTELKGDYIREIEGMLRKTELGNRQLRSDNAQLTEDLKRLKRTLNAQANEIARLKLL